MSLALAFVPGLLPDTPRLLSRFLPPLAEGVAAHYIRQHTEPGGLVLDPFGQAPQVALEALALERRIIVATLNPIARLALSLAVRPPAVADLRAALTRLADVPAGPDPGDRLERQILALYRTDCAQCRAPATADYFDWDGEAGEPVEKGYVCLACGGPMRAPASAADRELARRFVRTGPDYHFLLSRVASADDPDRVHAEEALAVYPARTLAAIGAVLVKLDGLSLDRETHRLLAGLLVGALDDATTLAQERPKVLAVPRRYREVNFWLALERAIGLVAGVPTGDRSTGLDSLLAAAAGPAIHAYAGSVRQLAGLLRAGSCPLVISALPRPNQAFWTLSALWTAWLWGLEQSEPLRSVLRRRRYDWNWHTRGLERTLAAFRAALAPDGRLVTLLAEAEPGLTAATLAAGANAGYALAGFALRADSAEVQAEWRLSSPSSSGSAVAETDMIRRVRTAAEAALSSRAEPSRWATVHAAAWVELALAGATSGDGDDVLGPGNRALEAAAREDGVLVRMGADPDDDPATGLWWLGGSPAAGMLPLADRVEAEVWRQLALDSPVDEGDLLAAAYAAFPGMVTPGRGLVLACLNSYAQRLAPDRWQLRAEDEPGRRAADLAEILAYLRALGMRQGFEVDQVNPQTWRDGTQPIYVFAVLTSAYLSTHLLGAPPAGRRRFLVLPGGRAGLAEFKLRRDPRLRPALSGGAWTIVKYRHIRRMAADAKLTRATLEPALAADPLEAARQLALPE